MLDNIGLELVQSVVNSQKDLIVLFHNDEPILTNAAFNRFVGASSFEQYQAESRRFVENFVPHPSYFNADKIEEGEQWFEAVLKLREIDRVVSMMTPSYEPHAFSVQLNQNTPEFTIATFTDITQTLIKRIMIENNANIDVNSGAYAKEYFLQISQSYEDAAVFNEKLIGATLISINKEDGSTVSKDESSALVSHYGSATRQDDMLIRWSNSSFLLIYLIDNESTAKLVTQKLESMITQKNIKGLECHLISIIQKGNESITALIKRID